MDSFHPFLGILTLLISINSSLQETKAADENKEKYIKQMIELYKCYGPGLVSFLTEPLPWDSIKGPVDPNCPMKTVQEENERKGIKKPVDINFHDLKLMISRYGQSPNDSLEAAICFGPHFQVTPDYQEQWNILPSGIVSDPGCPLLIVQVLNKKYSLKENIIKSNNEKLMKKKKNEQIKKTSSDSILKNNPNILP